MYGSSRLGIWRIDTVPTAAALWQISNYANRRQYELSNHLGNVMAVVGDCVTVENDTIKFPSVFSLNDYYVFGATKRWSGSEGYRYGFNGKENDDEVKGEGNQQYYGMRIYDPRLGKFLSVDPLTNSYPMLTPYQFASNTPIWAADLDGAEGNPYYLMPNTSVLTKGFKKAVKFAGEVAEGIVETAFMAIGALTEMPARIHYEHKVGSENVSTTFPLTGNQNLLNVGKGAVMAPIMSVQKILDDPGDGKNWGEGLFMAYSIRSLKKENPKPTGSLKVTAKNPSVSELNAANFMKDKGHVVELRDPVGTRKGGGTSDLLVDGTNYDVYTPITNNPNSIISSIAKKNSQATGVVLDLSNTTVTRSQLGNVLQRVQGAGAKKIKDIQIIGGN